jgi:hypothetical protein
MNLVKRKLRAKIWRCRREGSAELLGCFGKKLAGELEVRG